MHVYLESPNIITSLIAHSDIRGDQRALRNNFRIKLDRHIDAKTFNLTKNHKNIEWNSANSAIGLKDKIIASSVKPILIEIEIRNENGQNSSKGDGGIENLIGWYFDPSWLARNRDWGRDGWASRKKIYQNVRDQKTIHFENQNCWESGSVHRWDLTALKARAGTSWGAVARVKWFSQKPDKTRLQQQVFGVLGSN